MKRGTTPTPDLGAKHEGDDRQDGFLSVRTLSRQAHHLVRELGLPISGCRVRKLIRRYVREGRTGVDFRTWFLTYADPTGETAVRNVTREP